MPALLTTSLPLPNRREGKVRDIYDLPDGSGGRLLIIATDRISAFDVVMPTPITGKGAILTDVSLHWFRWIESCGLARTHVLSTDPADLAGLGSPPISPAQAEELRGRMMIVQRASVVPVECVARGYLDGSGWAEYQQTGAVCGVRLPPGLRRGDRLPQPIFTPATKEAVGTHDENVDFERAVARVADWLRSLPDFQAPKPASSPRRVDCGAPQAPAIMNKLRSLTLSIYQAAHEYAAERGLILADTKFEFGLSGDGLDSLILVDEALTPDSSRYWDAAAWKPGGEQKSFDKQFLREYLNRLTAEGTWDKKAPGPSLPPVVVEGTRARYEEVRARLWEESGRRV